MPTLGGGSDKPEARAWTLLSAHGLVLFFLGMNPDATLRDISERMGLTERTIHTVIKNLSRADMVRVRKVGRRHSYTLNPDAHFVHPMFAHLRVGSFLEALQDGRELRAHAGPRIVPVERNRPRQAKQFRDAANG